MKKLRLSDLSKYIPLRGGRADILNWVMVTLISMPCLFSIQGHVWKRDILLLVLGTDNSPAIFRVTEPPWISAAHFLTAASPPVSFP